MQQHLDSDSPATSASPRTVSTVAYSPRQAADASSLSLRHVMTAIAAGRLRSFKHGRRRLIFRDDLETYLKGDANRG